LFGPTFHGEGAIRLDDVTHDPRFGQNPPHEGILAGHLKVRSYMAVPVISRGGEVLGGLFFGHSRPCVFTARHEQFAIGIASWAAVALDNAHLYAKAQQANRLKDEFLATLSHELRTPMNAILGWVKMLRERRLEPAMQQRALEIIERNARAQAQLIEDLLDVSRIVSGKLAVKMEPVNLSGVVAAAVETLRPEAAAHGVTLGASVSAARTVVSGDADRLQQIVWNLLSNAIKFTPSGGRVQVTLQHAARQAEIVVSDTGQGIAQEFLPHVFDRFRQADSTSGRHHGGLGLGLSIVQHLTHAHGGTVAAASDGEGMGATFTVRLPLYTGAATDARPMAGPPSSRALDGVRVLLVDDEDDARNLLGYGLSAAAADVTQVASAGEALRAFAERRYDVLLSDLAMPGHDGYWLIRAIRAAAPERGGNIPAIAVTAYSGPRERDLALAAGYNWHVAKPVDLELVKTIVGELITEQHVEAALAPEPAPPPATGSE
jgi:signal transduction histidine kinase/ActR/RegA family two-component response regulator